MFNMFLQCWIIFTKTESKQLNSDSCRIWWKRNGKGRERSSM